MRQLRFLTFLMMMFLGLNLGFVSCGDEDEETTETSEIQDTKEGGVSTGESFYQYYAGAVRNGKGEMTKASLLVVYLSSYNGKSEDFQTGFFTGMAAKKYDLTNDLEKVSEYVGELDELKSLFSTWLSSGEASETCTNQIIEFLDSYVVK